MAAAHNLRISAQRVGGLGLTRAESRVHARALTAVEHCNNLAKSIFSQEIQQEFKPVSYSTLNFEQKSQAQTDPRRPHEADGCGAGALPVNGVRDGGRRGPGPAHVLRPRPLRHGGQRGAGAASIGRVCCLVSIPGCDKPVCERECSRADMVRVRASACLPVPSHARSHP